MTSPSNIKPREVWCPSCKKTIVTDQPAPTCDDCFGKPMLTVLYSLIDGKRITGADELGSTSS
jgi:hypothetical protein